LNYYDHKYISAEIYASWNTLKSKTHWPLSANSMSSYRWSYTSMSLWRSVLCRC